jgi:hypothetical protein
MNVGACVYCFGYMRVEVGQIFLVSILSMNVGDCDLFFGYVRVEVGQILRLRVGQIIGFNSKYECE